MLLQHGCIAPLKGLIMSNTVRKQLIIPAEIDREITSLAERKATSTSEIMRRAIMLYLRAAKMEREGLALGFSRDKSKLDTQVVGI